MSSSSSATAASSAGRPHRTSIVVPGPSSAAAKAARTVRYVDHELGRRAYVVSILDNHSRAIFSSALTRTQDLASHLSLDEERLRRLDSLLIVPEGENETPLTHHRRPPGPPSPKNFKDVLDRLTFVRSLGLPEDTGAGVHYSRLSRLAREGAKTTPQHLRRFDPLRRRATLVAYLSERSAELSDLALDMHDRMIGALMNRTEKMRDEDLENTARP